MLVVVTSGSVHCITREWDSMRVRGGCQQPRITLLAKILSMDAVNKENLTEPTVAKWETICSTVFKTSHFC